MNALDTYKKILTTLNYSDIVWTKYGSDTKEELAAKITRITYPEFEVPQVEITNVSKGLWKQEYSSGYNGYRCINCATWVYATEDIRFCNCDK